MSVESRGVRVLAARGESAAERDDWVAVEEPLEIRIIDPSHSRANSVSVAVTMRTPGHDEELAIGFLYGEALLRSMDDLDRRPELIMATEISNVVTLRFKRAFDTEQLKRNFFATSSCGVCGKATIDQVYANAPRSESTVRVDASTIVALPSRLRAAQRTFEATGGLHAAGAFTLEGNLLVSREDVGRHNALDKVIGNLLLAGASSDPPLKNRLLMVSGRLSFELVQKAAIAGAPILCAVSAPSSLAVQTADRLGMTLVGFLRDGSFNVYCGQDRIVFPSSHRE
jgi:FdhD protein